MAAPAALLKNAGGGWDYENHDDDDDCDGTDGVHVAAVAVVVCWNVAH